jgi:hypothetical protein
LLDFAKQLAHLLPGCRVQPGVGRRRLPLGKEGIFLIKAAEVNVPSAHRLSAHRPALQDIAGGPDV